LSVDNASHADRKKKLPAENAEIAEEIGQENSAVRSARAVERSVPKRSKARPGESLSEDSASEGSNPKSSAVSASSAVEDLAGAVAHLAGAEKKPMPSAIHPMLATATDKPFDDPNWLFEIKWDGYRAIAFIHGGHVRLVSRNQNELSAQFPELAALPQFVKAERAVLDGEIVALDDEGRPSFSLMQQRTGFRPGKARLPRREGVQVIYYAFDLLYLDGFDLRRVALERRKQLLQERVTNSDFVRFSDHYPEQGVALFRAAQQKDLEGIVGKKRDSIYHETRSREWLKIKITQRQECVVGGYTDPEGSRDYFGALVLGLYDEKRRLVHVGQVGSGFDQRALQDVFAQLQPLATSKNPFYGEIGGLKTVHFVRPELVAEVKFSEWTHETDEGGPKLRAPVFLGLRPDKSAEECTLEEAAK